MKHISTRPIFTLSFFTTKNPQIFQKSRYSSFCWQTQKNSSPSHNQRRQEDDRRCVPVSVWWDFENCNVQLNTNVFRVGQSITDAVRANKINGPIQITAFGDVMQISRPNQEALSSTGITLIHVPSGGKNSADRSLLVHLMCWVSENPPPAHLFLISGDRDFASILHKLRMNNYNILLASPDSAPSVLCSAATIMWQWSSLLKGENLTGKLFNHPPDGPNNSLYGHYKAPLEDPFAISEQSSCVHAEESKIRPIPKAVMKNICQILDLHPEGIIITQLREELSNKINLTIDKDLYGYKKFSRFLLAMPHILKLQFDGGKFIVRRVKPVPKSNVGGGSKTDGESGLFEDASEKSITPARGLEPKVNAQTNSVEARKEEKKDEFSSSMTMQGTKNKAHATNSQDVKKEEKGKEINPKRAQEVRGQDRNLKITEQREKSVPDETQDITKQNDKQMLAANTYVSEFGFIRKIWMKLFPSGDVNFSDKKDTSEAKIMSPALFSPSSHEALIYGENDGGRDVVNDVSGQDTSFLNQIMTWLRFSSSRDIDDKVAKIGGTEDLNNHNQLEMFSQESFWKEVESFIDTPQGSAIFSLSRTRDHLAQNLRKHGSRSLKSVSKPELLQLVDLLISDKKWVEESNSSAFPFKLTRNNPPPNLNGLSQIFSGKNPNLPESGERKHQNPPHTGIPQQHIVLKDLSSKTRSEVLADTQKLVDHIVKEHPQGFNLATFRKLFLQKNGYALDLQKLGYEKLVNLLQAMTGVRVESTFIFPAAGPSNNPDNQSSIQSLKNDDIDSWWDELGLVDNSGREKEKIDPSLTVQYDDSLDSEDEAPQNEVRNSKLEEESSLLQILDLWHKNRGCDTKLDESMDVNVLPDKTNHVENGYGSKSETLVVGPKGKHKPGKSHTFVTEQDVDNRRQIS